MGRRLYIGNLPYKTTDEDLRALFGQAGAVDNVQVMRDNVTGRARGFGFVEMVTDEDAQKAVAQFNQFVLDGRALVVNEARPKTPGGGRAFAGAGRDFEGDFSRSSREPRW
ncbi:MAG TPA: RNA-binding protein [Vicinamibacterales bacterium]|nr:RNA-binding protein [Vicinamibacterales bacterium]